MADNEEAADFTVTTEGKPLKAADRGELESSDEGPEDEDAGEFAGLFDFLKTSIAGLSGVRLSKRLRSSAAVLVAGEHGVSAQLERIMRQMGRGNELPPRERVLELNAEHPLIQHLGTLSEDDQGHARFTEYCELLYAQALMAEGSNPDDPARVSQLITRLMLGESGSSSSAAPAADTD